MVDRLKKDWRIVAPDWRGHVRHGLEPQGYYYQDYLADLDVIVGSRLSDAPLAILGHSWAATSRPSMPACGRRR